MGGVDDSAACLGEGTQNISQSPLSCAGKGLSQVVQYQNVGTGDQLPGQLYFFALGVSKCGDPSLGVCFKAVFFQQNLGFLIKSLPAGVEPGLSLNADHQVFGHG